MGVATVRSPHTGCVVCRTANPFVPCALSLFPADLLAGIVLIGCRRDPRLYARCEGAVSSPPGPCLVPLRSPIRAVLGTRSGSSRG